MGHFSPYASEKITIGVAHYAVRIKFSIYMHKYYTYYDYPLNYSMDEKTYRYDQNRLNYWSCYDIVTSPLQQHFNNSLTVGWTNTDSTLPVNINSCTSSCNCRCCDCTYSSSNSWCCTGYTGVGTTCGGCCSGSDCGYFTKDDCCENKYIQIDDLLVFVSRCPSNCSGCYSATKCTNCTAPYKLNL